MAAASARQSVRPAPPQPYFKRGREMKRTSRFKAFISAEESSRAFHLTITITLILLCMLLPYADAKTVSRVSHQNEQVSGRIQSPEPKSEHSDAGAGKYDIPDLAVLDQDGRRILFYSHLLKGKVVAINFVYTTCTAFCSAQGANFSKLQAILGDRLGNSVNLITITTDPEADTPGRLKAWSATFKAKPGWTMVTGEKKAVDEILIALTGDSGRKGMHSPLVLIANADKGVWIRDYGLADPERLAATIEEAATGKR
jgi:cytochrome oxidase Cu insertion factor (SCO1/SenC/PrrC family)